MYRLRTLTTSACTALCLALPLSSASTALAKDDSDLFVELVQGDFEVLTEPSKCLAVEPGGQPDANNLAPAFQYGRIAETLAHLALELEAGDAELEYRLAFTTERALYAYELAFDCAPTYENRYYLQRALRLISLRLDRLESTESFTEVAESAVPTLKSRRQELAAKLPEAPEPPTCPVHECPPALPPPTPQEPRPATEKYFLRVGIGLLAIPRLYVEEREYYNSSGVNASIALGARFLLGKKKRQLLEAGARGSLLSFRALAVENTNLFDNTDNDPNNDNIAGEQVPLYVLEVLPRYGYKVHPQHLSLYAELGLGVQALRFGDSFAAFQLSPGGYVCSVNDVLCINARYQASITTPSRELFNETSALVVALSFDVLRFAEMLIARKSR